MPVHYNNQIRDSSYRPVPSKNFKKTGRRRVYRRALSLLILVAFMVLAYHFLRDYNFSLNPLHKVAAAKVAASSPPVLSPSQQNQMAQQINAVIQANPSMDIGVAVEDLNSGKFYHYGISNPFVAASVAKLITATLFLHEVENGQQTMDQVLSYGTAQYELQQMIEQSDNTAWQDFNDLLTHDALASYATQIGLSNYDPDQNTLTVDDISILLGKIYQGKLLKRADTQLLLSYMHDANFDSYIPASVPAGVKIYHKAGWLDDRVHDAAIIDNGKHPYVLVIFTKMDDDSSYDAGEGHQVFAGITKATVKLFIK
jgi:beta-lactamase class A